MCAQLAKEAGYIRCREHLPCRIPHVEDELSAVGVELERVDLHAKSGWQQARVAVRSVRGARGERRSQPRRANGSLEGSQACALAVPHRARRDSPTYFFSNSPVKWRLTKVVLPTPPSPTSTNWQRAENNAQGGGVLGLSVLGLKARRDCCAGRRGRLECGDHSHLCTNKLARKKVARRRSSALVTVWSRARVLNTEPWRAI